MKARKWDPEEFKQEAVKLVLEQGMTPSQVARDLGIGFDTLQRWGRATRPSTDCSNDATSTTAELVRLRREVERLRMERAILKKALGHLLADAPVSQKYAFVAAHARRYPGYGPVPGTGAGPQRVLCVETASNKRARAAGCAAHHPDPDHFS